MACSRMAQALPVANAHYHRERAPRRVAAALAAWGWRIKRQAVEVCMSVDGGLLYGTSCEGNVCRKHFTGVCGCRRIDAKLRV